MHQLLIYKSPMMRALLACFYLVFWKFTLLTSSKRHPTYPHIRWRIWEEKKILSNFLEGDLE